MDAARDALDRLTAPGSHDTADAPKDALAQPTAVLVDERQWSRLKPQAQECVRLMRANGGLTNLEAMHAGIGRLSARILEIRSVFGDGSVVTDMSAGYARYEWRGPECVQVELVA